MSLIDIHQHLVYGVDDGPQTLETSLEMLSNAWRQGVSRIVATSHAYPAMELFPKDRYLRHVFALRQACREKGIPIRIYFGCEIFYSDIAIWQLQQNLLPTLAGTRFVLIEFDPTVQCSEICDAVRKLSNSGYRVIVAHCERYPALYDSLDAVERLAMDFAACFQINAHTIIKHPPRRIRKFCDAMLERHYVSFIASDAHNCDSRAIRLKEAYEEIGKRYGEGYAWQLFSGNQERCLFDQYKT